MTSQSLTETECGTQHELSPKQKERPHCHFYSSHAQLPLQHFSFYYFMRLKMAAGYFITVTL